MTDETKHRYWTSPMPLAKLQCKQCGHIWCISDSENYGNNCAFCGKYISIPKRILQSIIDNSHDGVKGEEDVNLYLEDQID